MRTIKEKVEKPGKIERIEKIIEREKKIDNDIEENEEKNEPKEEDKEANLKKLKGFFDLMNGIDKLTKKEGMNQALPKLENYLKDNKLTSLINNIKKELDEMKHQKELDELRRKHEIEDMENKKFIDINKDIIYVVKASCTDCGYCC